MECAANTDSGKTRCINTFSSYYCDCGAENGEAVEREESGNYDIYANKKCSESNIGTYEDDCEERCDDKSECGAFVIVSNSYCKLYSECTCPGQIIAQEGVGIL